MQKTILVTGATDGIGLATTRHLLTLGHKVLVHGRNPDKLQQLVIQLRSEFATPITSYLADLSNRQDVAAMADKVTADHHQLDVLINNAGIFKTPDPITSDNLDVRFAVNTLAPYLLTKRLLAIMPADGRVINVSSAAQAEVNLSALAGDVNISNDFNAYAQSKTAITMWSAYLAKTVQQTIIAVNPGSMLGSKMVKDGFGVAGGDIQIGVDILTKAALSNDFAQASGRYFDNDIGIFTHAHPDVENQEKCQQLINALDKLT